MSDRQDPRLPAGPPEEADPEYSAYDEDASAPGAPGAYADDSDAFEPDLRAEVAAHYATEQLGIPAPYADVDLADVDLADVDLADVDLADVDLDAEPAEEDGAGLSVGEPAAAHLPSSAYDDDFRDIEPATPFDETEGTEEAEEAEAASLPPLAPAEGVAAEPEPELEPELEPVESGAAATLATADADAASDLARAPRMSQYRSQRRRFTSMVIAALLLIALGALFLSVTLTPELGELPPAVMLGITATAAALSLIGRFVFNGRRERGLFALGALILLWTGLLALVVNGNLAVGQGWPLGIAAVGAALLLTFVFERNHERGLLLPGFALIVAGIIAVPFGVGLIPREVTATLALLWPLLLLIPALALAPLAFRARTE